MKTRDIPLAEATVEQLRQFANGYLGLFFPPNTSEATIRAKIDAAWDKPTIAVMEADEDAPLFAEEDNAPKPAVASAPTPAQPLRPFALDVTSRGDPKVRLIVQEQAGPGGKRPVFVGVNGVSFTIPRGKEVEIPYRYYAALNDAIEDRHEQDEQTGEINTSRVPSYPFQIVMLPPQAEVDAWNEAKAAAQRREVAERLGRPADTRPAA